MNQLVKTYTLLFLASIFLIACDNSGHNENGHDHENHEEPDHHEHGEGHEEEVHISEQQFQSLDMKVDTIPLRNISSYVEANGQLKVPPQNQAAVTAIIGSNVTSINVIEGEVVGQGQVLAYLSHPDLIKLQTDYSESWNQLQYLEKEHQRQKKLYEEKVGSGKEYQKIQADYLSMKGNVTGYEAQLKLMGLSPEHVKQGEISEKVPVTSPISGHISLVKVKTGQFVQPQTEMFEIVNVDFIHADLLVFEKDVHKVKDGQQVSFFVESLPDVQLEATIFAIGKSFEQVPKGIHVHAEISRKKGMLLPGMYIRGRILTEDVQTYALPESALVREGNKHFIFTAQLENTDGETEWAFKPTEVIIGAMDDGWVEIKLLKTLPNDEMVAWNNAFYLMAEMKKGETEHSH